jgi:hypothetical protein
MRAMTDQNAQNQGGYVGGFSFATGPMGASAPATGMSAGTQSAQGAQASQAPVQPVYNYGPAPAPAQPMPVAPLGGMADPYDSENPSTPPFDPNYRFADRMKNWTTSIKVPAHALKFNEAYFLNLLAGSISLTKDEKKKIVDSIPKLRQEQIDELVRIFEEERSKFIELSIKHGAQLKKLEDEHAADWKDIELSYVAIAKKEEEDKKADEIRKQLGLS